jgi:hypothetical protein
MFVCIDSNRAGERGSNIQEKMCGDKLDEYKEKNEN